MRFFHILVTILPCLIGLMSSQSFATKTILVSDIDDTIKRTGIHDKLALPINATGTTNEFAGMSILYKNWFKNKKATDQIYYLTSAPVIFDIPGLRISLDVLGKKFLEVSNYPPGTEKVRKQVISGRKSIEESSSSFKTDKLIELYNKEKPDIMLLIGDNGEQDIIAYDNIKKYIQDKKSNTKILTYIHHVYENTEHSIPLLADQNAFLTSADLAVQLYNLKLINKDGLEKVISEVLYDSSTQSELTETVIPSFMECNSFGPWPELNMNKTSNEDTLKNYDQIRMQVQYLCN